MRILYLITQSIFGGAQTHVSQLLGYFGQMHDVHLVVGNRGFLTCYCDKHQIPVTIVPQLARAINIWADMRAIKAISKIIDEFKPDVIHAHSSKAGFVGRIVGRISGVPTIFTAHGWAFAPNTPIVRRQLAWAAEWIAARNSQPIICVSEYDKKLAIRAKIATPERIEIIKHGIPLAGPIANRVGINPPRFVMVARFSEQKDQKTLIHATNNLSDLDFQVDFIGSGPYLEECKQLVSLYGLESRISFLEDRKDVPELLAGYQVFVLSTHYEGLPISIMEAMRAGLPIIATDTCGIPEEVEDGRNGFLVPLRDPEYLAATMRRLIENPSLRVQQGLKSREMFVDRFVDEKMFARINELYLRVII